MNFFVLRTVHYVLQFLNSHFSFSILKPQTTASNITNTKNVWNWICGPIWMSLSCPHRHTSFHLYIYLFFRSNFSQCVDGICGPVVANKNYFFILFLHRIFEMQIVLHNSGGRSEKCLTMRPSINKKKKKNSVVLVLCSLLIHFNIIIILM